MKPLGSGRYRNRTLALITLIMTSAASIGWFIFAYQPTLDEVARLEAEIASLRGQVDRSLRARERLPDVLANIDDLEAARSTFLAELPSESDMSGLVEQLRSAARRSGVALTSLAQGSVTQSGNIADVRTIGFTIDARGRYAAMMVFLAELEALQRYARIHEIRLGRTDDTMNPYLDARFHVNVFAFTGPEPQRTAAATP